MVDIKTPIKIGTKTLPNRITFAPTVKFDWTDRSGIAIERFAQHYEARAKGGAGLICVEALAYTRKADWHHPNWGYGKMHR